MLPGRVSGQCWSPFPDDRQHVAQLLWLTNDWRPTSPTKSGSLMTVATIAHVYRRMLTDYAEKTGSCEDFIDWQGHCFADRGMSGMMDAAKSCSSHSTSFLGTDSVSSMDWIDFVYQGKRLFSTAVRWGRRNTPSACVDGERRGKWIRSVASLPPGIRGWRGVHRVRYSGTLACHHGSGPGTRR